MSLKKNEGISVEQERFALKKKHSFIYFFWK